MFILITYYVKRMTASENLIVKNFFIVTEENKQGLLKSSDINAVYYSVLKEGKDENAFRSLCLKHVLEGEITYKTPGSEYKLRAGQVMVASKQPGVKAFFSSESPVISICIDINPALITEVFSVLSANNLTGFEKFANGYFTVVNYSEKLSCSDAFFYKDFLGHVKKIYHGESPEPRIRKEWFYALAEQLILQVYKGFLSQSRLPFSKFSTREEIYRRLRIAKEYMDENFLSIRSNNEIAARCMLSEYHFIRSFGQLYNVSPFQYLQRLRLTYSMSLIRTTDWDLSYIASICGFQDISTFSKSFKRHYKISPSAIRK